jgi:uncharacterized cofD-like protein
VIGADPATATLAAPRPGLARALRVVAIGGGTGLPPVLAGFAAARPAAERRALDVTAVVTTCDDGGSSGELRRRYGIPSPGDVRNCLVAMAARRDRLASLFQHRFTGDGALAGHTVGNLVLTALTQQLGGFDAAVRAAAELLGVRGRVLPATERSVELVAALDDGRLIHGESAIAAARGRVGRLFLDGRAPAAPGTLAAIAGADLVVLGPGSLYSSIIASLLVDGIAEALASCHGVRALMLNLFTQPGETDGYDAVEHVRAVERHAGAVVDVAVAHAGPMPQEVVERYAAQGSRPVRVDRAALERLGVAVLEADLLGMAGERARHDPARTAAALLRVAAP